MYLYIFVLSITFLFELISGAHSTRIDYKCVEMLAINWINAINFSTRVISYQKKNKNLTNMKQLLSAIGILFNE